MIMANCWVRWGNFSFLGDDRSALKMMKVWVKWNRGTNSKQTAKIMYILWSEAEGVEEVQNRFRNRTSGIRRKIMRSFSNGEKRFFLQPYFLWVKIGQIFLKNQDRWKLKKEVKKLNNGSKRIYYKVHYFVAVNFTPSFLKYCDKDLGKKKMFFLFSTFNYYDIRFSISKIIFIMHNCLHWLTEISRHWRNTSSSYERDYRIIVKYHKGNSFTNRRGNFYIIICLFGLCYVFFLTTMEHSLLCSYNSCLCNYKTTSFKWQ